MDLIFCIDIALTGFYQLWFCTLLMKILSCRLGANTAGVVLWEDPTAWRDLSALKRYNWQYRCNAFLRGRKKSGNNFGTNPEPKHCLQSANPQPKCHLQSTHPNFSQNVICRTRKNPNPKVHPQSANQPRAKMSLTISEGSPTFQMFRFLSWVFGWFSSQRRWRNLEASLCCEVACRQ